MKLPCTLSLVLLCILIGPTAGVDAQADGESPRIVIDDGCGLWSERDTGFWVSAEALLWNRTQSTGGGTIIGGPESLEFGNQSYTYEGGYRLGLGWLIDPNYEVEGIWTQFHGWNAGSSGFLSHAISFDLTANLAPEVMERLVELAGVMTSADDCPVIPDEENAD